MTNKVMPACLLIMFFLISCDDKAILELNKNYKVDSVISKAQILLKEKNYQEGVNFLKIAEEKHPNNLSVKSMLAAFYLVKDVYESDGKTVRINAKPDDALLYLKLLADLIDDTPQFKLSYANVLIDLRRYKEAEKVYLKLDWKQILSKNSKFQLALTSRLYGLIGASLFEEAIKLYEYAVKIDNSHSDFAQGLMQAMMFHGFHDKANQFGLTYLENNSDSPAINYMVCKSIVALKDYDNATNCFKSLLKKVPADNIFYQESKINLKKLIRIELES